MTRTPKPVASGVIVKQTGTGWRILTQVRKVLNESYDPLYDATYECVGETLGCADEPYVQALLRGIEEECGVPAGDCVVHGENFRPVVVEGISTQPGDKYIVFSPLLFTQSVGEPQPWHSLGFMVQVGPDWEPRHEEGDGEAGEPRWWNPSELLDEMERDRTLFMGLHFALLRKVASHLAS